MSDTGLFMIAFAILFHACMLRVAGSETSVSVDVSDVASAIRHHAMMTSHAPGVCP